VTPAVNALIRRSTTLAPVGGERGRRGNRPCSTG
jgi:hypothetical protein